MFNRFCSILFLAIGGVILMVVPVSAETVDTAWVGRYNGPGNSQDYASGIALDGLGNVYVTGASTGIGTFYDYTTIKYYPNGDTAWVRRYDGPGNYFDEASAIAVDGHSNIYVTGSSYDNGAGNDYATIKYYSNGDTAWVRRYNGPGNDNDRGNAIAVDDSGNVYVTGYSSGEYATIKYYSDGDTAWVRRYNGPGNNDDRANAIAVGDSGNIYVTGYSFGSGTGEDYATIKYYSNGDTAWVRRYNGPENHDDMAFAMTLDGFGNVYVTGYSAQDSVWPKNCDYATIKYYSNGDTAWVRRYNGPGDADDEAAAIVADSYGNVCVTGYSAQHIEWPNNEDYATIKYHPNGDTAWVRRYNGPGNATDVATAIAVDGSGNVYIAGGSTGDGTSKDYATIKYSLNGDIAWVARYNGPGNGEDAVYWAMALDGSANVYVTGYSDGSGLISDYATIKYVQGFSHISIVDFAFDPQVDTITIGDSVRWTNNGAVSHTSTSDAKSLWDSGTLNPGESFTFQFNDLGSYPYHCEFHLSMAGTIVVLSTDVKDETGDREKPSEFALSQNYPNPFNQTTKIEFTLSKSGFVSLNIYDILGRKVRTLVSEHVSSGYKSVFWDGKNDLEKHVASGIYFYQIEVGDFSETKKFVLLK